MSWFKKKNTTEQVTEIELEEAAARQEDLYIVTIRCRNCNDRSRHEIQQGTTVVAYLKDKVCENCQCTILTDKKTFLEKDLEEDARESS